MKKTKESFLNQSLILNSNYWYVPVRSDEEVHTKQFPATSKVLHYKDIWDVHVVGMKNEHYECLLTMSNGSISKHWIHCNWIQDKE